MLTKTKIALVAALVAGSATAASAQGFDPNGANRFPAYTAPGVSAPYLGVMQGTDSRAAAPQANLQSAPVALHQRRTVVAPQGTWQSAPVAGRFDTGNYGGQQYEYGAGRNDRASSPYAGGVN